MHDGDGVFCCILFCCVLLVMTFINESMPVATDQIMSGSKPQDLRFQNCGCRFCDVNGISDLGSFARCHIDGTDRRTSDGILVK